MRDYIYITLVVLYLFSFQYKFSNPFFDAGIFPIILAFAVHGCSVWIMLKSKPYLNNLSLIAILLFSLTIIVSAFCHTGNPHSFSKIVFYLMMTMPAYIWGYGVFGPNIHRQKQLIFAILLFTGFVSVAALLHLITDGHLKTLWGNNYLVSGQSIGIAAILLQIFIVKNHKPWILSGGVGLLVGLLCFNGGRGPLIMAVLTLIVYYGQQYLRHDKKRITLDFSALVGGCGLFIGLQSVCNAPSPTGIMRTVAILKSPLTDGPMVERLTYYQQALDLFCAHPIDGVGFGLFSAAAGNADISLHPHNIFLEIGSELGLLGLVLFMIISLPLLKALFFSFQRPMNAPSYHPGILFVGLFLALNALKSGDLNDNILLFFCLGIMGYRVKKQG